MLEHHADAQFARLRRAGELDLPALPTQFARRRLHETVHDFDQRRFSGTVLAEQRVNFRWEQLDADRIVGGKAAVTLGDIDGLQQRFLARSGGRRGIGHDVAEPWRSIDAAAPDKANNMPSARVRSKEWRPSLHNATPNDYYVRSLPPS